MGLDLSQGGHLTHGSPVNACFAAAKAAKHAVIVTTEKDAVDLFTKVERAFFPAVPHSRDEALNRYVQNPYDGFPKAERPNGLCL